MKPLINEFRFYQKTQKSILGQKSELQKVIEKRQQREKVKQLEEERQTKQKTNLEKILELRAMKIDANQPTNHIHHNHTNSATTVTINHANHPQQNPVNQQDKKDDVTSRKVMITVNSLTQAKSQLNSVTNQINGDEAVGHVKLILKSIESKASQTANSKFCKRLDFPSAGSPWSPTTNYVR